MEKQTIKTILSDIQMAVQSGRTVSPNEWINWALSLSGLWPELKSELTKAEILYTSELAKLMEDDKMSKGKAEIIVKSKVKLEGQNMSAYELYKYLLGRDKLVDEFVKLCKVRARLEQSFN